MCAVLVQGGVSDRDYGDSQPETAELVLHARRLVAAGEDEGLMPRSASLAPISASRYLSLSERLGGDDYFSNDLTGSCACASCDVGPPVLSVLCALAG